MEKDGQHYRFIIEREFIAMRERGEFLEWAEVHGNFYGTPRAFVEENLARGRDVLLEIDVQGARSVKRAVPDAALIFIEAPSMGILEQRLRRRRTEREDELSRRIAAAYDELRSKQWFAKVVVNTEIDQAVEEVLHVIDTLKANN
jgi:guanylate kinase